MRGSYYNEWDAYAAQWLRNLIAAGHLPAGDVDERSITEVQADDLKSYTQCHFFAGIGGWAYALSLAGWPADRPVWTGSCPCQPFSAAGKQSGAADDRHLWPVWFRLIDECGPDRIFGEQVEGAVGFGWLDRVFADLEAKGYACGAAVLGAHSAGAPHIRQRLWWVADASDTGSSRSGSEPQHESPFVQPGHCSGEEGPAIGGRGAVGGRGASFWGQAEWIACADGKSRRIEPSIQPLAHGVSARVGKLRAAGNAIVPQVAAQFITASMECRP